MKIANQTGSDSQPHRESKAEEIHYSISCGLETESVSDYRTTHLEKNDSTVLVAIGVRAIKNWIKQ